MNNIVNILSKRNVGKYYNTICSLNNLIEDMSNILTIESVDNIIKEFDKINIFKTTDGIQREEGFILYFMIRLLKPDNLLETGTSRGVSSTYIVNAMKENGKGRMVTIDSSPMSGEDIPFQLQDRIIFYQGKSGFEYYDEIKIKHAPFDIIFLDSAHNYQNVISELYTFGFLLKRNGIIICHDAKMDHIPEFGVGQACREFVEKTKSQLIILDTTCGMAVIRLLNELKERKTAFIRKDNKIKIKPLYTIRWIINRIKKFILL